MPVTPNGLVYTTATVITQSQSITGSFIGCLALSSGSATATPAAATVSKPSGNTEQEVVTHGPSVIDVDEVSLASNHLITSLCHC